MKAFLTKFLPYSFAFLLCAPVLSGASEIICNDGAMTITPETEGFPLPNLSILTVHDDGVVWFFHNAFRRWTRRENDCYNDVCNYVFEPEYTNIKLLGRMLENGFQGFGGRMVALNALQVGDGMRLTMIDIVTREKINWTFEKCVTR